MTDTSSNNSLPEVAPVAPPTSQMQDIWRQFKQHKGAVMGGGFLLFITLFVLIGPAIWTVEATKLDIRAKDMRPIIWGLFDDEAKVAWNHPLGTDQLAVTC